jgi:hypothetical protein
MISVPRRIASASPKGNRRLPAIQDPVSTATVTAILVAIPR